MVPPSEDHTGLIGTTFPLASNPAAVYGCVWSAVMVAPGGDTSIRASPPAMTVTVAVPERRPSVAATVQVPTDDGEKSPVPEIEPFVTDQIGLTGAGFMWAS